MAMNALPKKSTRETELVGGHGHNPENLYLISPLLTAISYS